MRSLLVMVCLLGSATSASAECAWVLWEGLASSLQAENPRYEEWTGRRVEDPGAMLAGSLWLRAMTGPVASRHPNARAT